MAKVKYRNVNFRTESKALIDKCDAIVVDYMDQDYRLTLRQLYYQLVTKNLIPNDKTSYKKLTSLITDARYAGLIDWDAIEDRVRQPKECSDWLNVRSIVDAALYSYRLPRWKGQKHYAELWVEKDALAGVIAPIASEHHVTLMVNKGYSSATAMREAALRFKREVKYPEGTRGHTEDRRRKLVLLYLGDLDPSGEDMARDIRTRFAEFGAKVHVRKIALTIDQVTQYSPPPNPAKIKDPRADAYIKKYGNSSWEVDALPPKVLRQVIEDEFDTLIDRGLMDAIKAMEEDDKAMLRKATDKIVAKRRQEPPWVDHDPGFDDDEDEPEDEEEDGEAVCDREEEDEEDAE